MDMALKADFFYEEPYKTEVLNGKKIVQMANPSVNHGIVSQSINRALDRYFYKRPCLLLPDRISVFLTPADTVVPDLMVVCNREIIKEKGVYGAPDLIVEILSPSTAKYDKGYKKDLYARCCVKEYWIADPRGKSVEVHVLKEEMYVLDYVYMVFKDFEREDLSEQQLADTRFTLISPTFPGLQIEVNEIFKDLI